MLKRVTSLIKPYFRIASNNTWQVVQGDISRGQEQETQALKPMSLKKNISWTFLGNSVFGACQWLMLVVLARLGSPEMVGQFALGLAVTAPIMLLTGMRLRTLQATDYRREYQFSEYLGVRVIGVIAACATIVFCSFQVSDNRQTILVILALGLARIVESVSDLFYGLFQQHEQMDRLSVSLMLRGTLSLVALGGTVYWTGNVVYGALAVAVVWGAVCLFYDLPTGAVLLSQSVSQVIVPRWNWQSLRKIVVQALPVGLAAALVSLQTNLPRYALEKYVGTRELGIFGALAGLMMASMLLIRAVNHSSIPRLARYYAEKQFQSFRKLLLKLTGVFAVWGVLGLLIVSLAGREILLLTYGEEYAQYHGLFQWMMVAYAIRFLRMPVAAAVRAMRKFWWQFAVHVSVILIALPACLILIPRLGMLGAVYAVMISVLAETIAYALLACYALWHHSQQAGIPQNESLSQLPEQAERVSTLSPNFLTHSVTIEKPSTVARS